MPNLPNAKKGFGSSLTRYEKIRKTVLGVALAVGMSAGAAASLPATANATVPSVTPTSNDRGAIVLIQQSAQSGRVQVADHYSHMSHSSHASHVSHYSSSY
jgi:hypothetical protein